MPMKALTEGDKLIMTNWINEYALTDGQLSTEDFSDVERVLYHWSEAKKELFRAFDGNLIIGEEIEYKMGMEELYEEMSYAMNHASPEVSQFIQEFRALTHYKGYFEYNYDVESLLEVETLIQNHPDTEFETILPNGKRLKVTREMKLMRAISRIAEACDIPYFEEFRILHSQVLNQKVLKGNLCLSIHPMDYMTMSDNDCGWNSCMSWEDDGDYRAGTVEMMNSPMVVVAYLTANNTMFNGWNNKKWRELFIVTPDLITGIKGYPYENEYLEQIVASKLRDMAERNLGFRYKDLYTGTWENNKDFCMRCTTMYCDFSSRVYNGFVGINADYRRIINYSGMRTCMKCGKIADFNEAHELECMECNHKVRCYECGDLIYRETAEIIDDIYYCRYCADELLVECPACGARINIEDTYHTIKVYFSLDGKKYCGNLYFYLCKDCINYSKVKIKYNEIDSFYYACLEDAPEDVWLDYFSGYPFNSIEDIRDYWSRSFIYNIPKE